VYFPDRRSITSRAAFPSSRSVILPLTSAILKGWWRSVIEIAARGSRGPVGEHHAAGAGRLRVDQDQPSCLLRVPEEALPASEQDRVDHQREFVD
jgi:hypothetical protein